MTTTQERPQHELENGRILPPPPPPLAPVEKAPRRSPAEEARTLLASTTVGALGTLCEDGSPWASLVAFATLDDALPVLMISTLAEHGQNLAHDKRASLMVAHPEAELDQLAHGRVTLSGAAERAAGDLAEAARSAYLAAVPAANAYERFGDFGLWILRPDRVRWVGGYGRMDFVGPDEVASAEPDPTAPDAARAVAHLNEDHTDALLAMARALGGYPDALAAECTGIDRYGIELRVEGPRGVAPTRVGFAEPIAEAGGLRGATVELARRARAAGSCNP
jgi:putative heme iron utilization protein